MNLLSDEAMKENVDLQRLYVEMVESLVGVGDFTMKLPGNLRAAPIEHDVMRRQIRDLGYESLKNRQWATVLELDEIEGTEIMDNLERFMSAYGRYIKIGDRNELKIALAAYETLKPHLPRDPFLHCLAETALNQVLDERKIGRIEMSRVNNGTDAELSQQNSRIAHLVREKIGEVLNGGF